MIQQLYVISARCLRQSFYLQHVLRIQIRRVPRRSLSYASVLMPMAGGFAYALHDRGSICEQESDCGSSNLHATILCSVNTPILSQLEPEMNAHDRFFKYVEDKIWVPLMIAFRFVHLFAIFMPVILTAPLLLVGTANQKHDGERWGAIWWYRLLTRQMERAGPTFVKVCLH